MPWEFKYPGLVFSMIVLWLLGLWDDLRGLSASIRFQVEATLAVFLMFCGWQLHWFSSPWIDLPLTFLWIVGITNAFNLIDNTDGLCAGITLVAAVFLAAITGNIAVYALVGICLAFWIFNFPPAMMWMGDCGSLFLGVNMACLSMDSKIGMWAILILIVPIADTIFVVARRLEAGRSPFQGGKDHLSHVLGRWALPVLYLAGILGGGLAWVLA
jgi:UDP-GlcNAc:undecaprenyl-phosphate GlcNAc-1-phosphate transferase